MGLLTGRPRRPPFAGSAGGPGWDSKLLVCGKFARMEKAQDTGDVYRFGPLRSVIPYSCVLVDLCMKKLQRAGEPESSYSRNPLLLFFSLLGSTLQILSPFLFLFFLSDQDQAPLLSGQGPPFISQGDTTRTTSTYFLFWWGPILFSLKLGLPSLES